MCNMFNTYALVFLKSFSVTVKDLHASFVQSDKPQGRALAVICNDHYARQEEVGFKVWSNRRGSHIVRKSVGFLLNFSFFC